ncbi:MAG: TatD family hydrolase, partial [Pseudomonadota bacterium]
MLVDSHCHLDFPDFEDELDDVVARAGAAGVGLMVTICTRVRQFDQVLAVAQRYPNVFCSVGTHPNNASEETDVSSSEIMEKTISDDVIAVGEAGLDYHYAKSTPADQKRGLKMHIEIARETGLPLVIHARDADRDMIDILESESAKGLFPAILHCFSSGPALAKVGVDLGHYVSFSGILTFKNAQEIRDIAADVPSDRLLVETDAPYLAPTPYRGRRNEPAFTSHTAQVLADVKGVSEAEIARQTTENFFRLFKKVPRRL